MCTTAISTLLTYPKAGAHEGVDERVAEAVGHGQPVTGDVDVEPEVVTAFAAHVNVAVREEELVQFDRRPADEEDQQDGHQHFDGLKVMMKKMNDGDRI